MHQQVIVWAMRDGLDLPVDTWNSPRFRLARLNPCCGRGRTAHQALPRQAATAAIIVGKISNKGRQNRRINIMLTE